MRAAVGVEQEDVSIGSNQRGEGRRAKEKNWGCRPGAGGEAGQKEARPKQQCAFGHQMCLATAFVAAEGSDSLNHSSLVFAVHMLTHTDGIGFEPGISPLQ